MRALPKSRLLVAAESTLLAVVLAALAVLWARRGAPAAAPRADDSRRMAQPSLTLARRSAPAAEAGADGARALRAKGPAYGRAFAELYDTPAANPLHLTAEQIDALQECYNRLYEDRLELEARLAKAEAVDGGGVFIEIPAYPDEGRALEQVFLASLNDRLGEALAGAVAEQYLQMIEAGNEGLGQYAQQLLVTPDGENTGRLKVVHSAETPEGATRITREGTLTEADFRDYGPLAANFPKP